MLPRFTDTSLHEFRVRRRFVSENRPWSSKSKTNSPPQDDESPPPSAPPVFTPPDAPSFLLAPQQVTITHTQPTPVGDQDPNAGKERCILCI